MTFLSIKAFAIPRAGLLAPAEIDRETGYPRYLLSQVSTAQAIRRVASLVVALAESMADLHFLDN